MDKQSPKIKHKVAALVEETKKVKVDSIKGAKVITDREQALALTADKASKELALAAKRKSAAKKATKKKATKAKKTAKKAVKRTTKRKAAKKKSKR